MRTERLFREDVYLKEFSATVAATARMDGSLCLLLDRTAFFPEGGGQSCDTGSIGPCTVEYVFEKDGEIWHKIAPGAEPAAGSRYDCRIDWERRFRNMQRHLGEHILTGIFYREYGGVNRGFHMGENYMTIDISLEDEAAADKITYEMAEKAEIMANRVIWDDVPVIVHHYDTYEEARDLPMRKALNIREDISIVSIGSKDSVWGSVACCGTHPSSTGQVGLIKLYKVEPNKGMWRVYFDAGGKALENCIEKQHLLEAVSGRYSAGDSDLLRKIEIHERKNEETRRQLQELKKKLLAEKAAEIQPELDGSTRVYSFDLFTPDDCRHLVRLLTIQGLVIFLDTETCTALLFSSGQPDCGRLVKDNAPAFNGRGGGRSDNAQAKFKDREDMRLFAGAMEMLGR